MLVLKFRNPGDCLLLMLVLRAIMLYLSRAQRQIPSFTSWEDTHLGSQRMKDEVGDLDEETARMSKVTEILSANESGSCPMAN
jgi:hypothetical protein